jgi:hypothetical protein
MRYVHRQSGTADTIWTLTSMTAPLTMAEPVHWTFTEELTQKVFRRSTANLAQDILEGNMREVQMLAQSNADTAPVALNSLLATMSRKQVNDFKMKASYVLALARANVGQSHKSLEFVNVIENLHAARMNAWESQVVENPGQATTVTIEAKAPAPTSVYRWYLRYRKAGDDLQVLALSNLATRTRTPRKPEQKALLAAFMASRMAFVERDSVAKMTVDFNRLVQDTNVHNTDVLIEQLYAQANATAYANKVAKSGKTSMSSKHRRAQAIRVFPQTDVSSR